MGQSPLYLSHIVRQHAQRQRTQEACILASTRPWMPNRGRVLEYSLILISFKPCHSHSSWDDSRFKGFTPFLPYLGCYDYTHTTCNAVCHYYLPRSRCGSTAQCLATLPRWVSTLVLSLQIHPVQLARCDWFKIVSAIDWVCPFYLIRPTGT